MSIDPVTSILIVGGGAAGWLSAGIIAARYGKSMAITLIESSDIATIGVGEGSWPSLRNTLRDMGIAETDFFRECDASFKQGVKFNHWKTGEQQDFYYHPFSLPVGFIERNMAEHWLREPQGSSFADAVCAQEKLCENNLAPRTRDTPEYKSHVNYGYHLDAGKFIRFLREHCKSKLGVQHVLGTINQVKQNANGIASIETTEGQQLSADLFIDCSGLKSLLLGETLGARFIDKSDELFIDSAVAVQVPYASEDTPILPYTLASAQTAGWIWEIGLYSRKGIGHVYSSRHMSEDEATHVLQDYVGKDFAGLSPRKLEIPCGYRECFWLKNCVAIGMSAGFIEPLEASALVMVELAANYIRDQLPQHKSVLPIVAKRFNELQTYRWQRIVEFLKLHYVLSQRNTRFWIDNREPHTIPESLRESLALWRYHVPYKKDFLHKEEVFPSASYQYILYGMGFAPELHHYGPADEPAMFARRLAENEKIKNHLSSILPDTRSLLKAMRGS
ncbi:tryptophan halogenase family protein [Cellvibrio japonicus]|uniref:Tryptophan halogenase n=1 Tax=Cellvibrio japonicus (strain Ueda107) TaxID=498211 RepID=B3PB77_CELJU|nr:tryptophan halogenase family protein [Cellvibrio japonicus]ACE82984.1 tryptophan halogenase [Cellvibrio japonicus Ueda107]QEI11665.1 tryptophan 7-halogenase [Cellvibrio japonicus]QEI15239.1 tryptophan 7-halogenase [Cellvibrio japonicus]QEI18819.1 tryptophan 7-halogenase [Cellvibrio japonicus]